LSRGGGRRQAGSGTPTGGLEVAPQVGPPRGEQLATRNDEDVHGPARPGRILAENFSNQTFSPVSGDSCAELLRGDDSEAAARTNGRGHQDRQVSTVNAHAAIEHPLKLAAAADSLSLRKTPGRHDSARSGRGGV
jgi:hypothetical protein